MNTRFLQWRSAKMAQTKVFQRTCWVLLKVLLPRRVKLVIMVLVLILMGFSMSGVSADCLYKNEIHYEGVYVPTREPCLNCTCNQGALLCHLRICPRLPDPPPIGCILLHKYKTCCPRLICPDNVHETNQIEARSDTDNELDLFSTSGLHHNHQLDLSHACMQNGTIYAPGSAMDSSSFCEYCFCIGKNQICIKPKCLLHIDGCRPVYDKTDCCPVKYICTHTTATVTSTTETIKSKDYCLIDNVSYENGKRILDLKHSACDNCYCLHGTVHCEALSCSPNLHGCSPIVKEGDCCPASYNCSGTIEIHAEANYGHYPIVTKDYAKLRKEDSSYSMQTNNTYSTKTVQSTPKSKKEKLILEDYENSFGNLLDSMIKDKTERKLNVSEDVTTSTVDYTVTSTEEFSSTQSSETTTQITNEFETTNPTTNQYPITIRQIINSTDCSSESVSNESELKIKIEEINDIGTSTELQFDSTTTETISDRDITEIDIETKLNVANTTTKRNIVNLPINPLIKTNSTKKGDLDEFDEYDYSQESLPPSLPNLRIIPFVAADALDSSKNSFLESKEVLNSDHSHFVSQGNLFSPPTETESGFIPKPPPILNLVHENGVSLMSSDTSTISGPKQNNDCVVDNNQNIPHGELIESNNQCTSCICLHGDIVCQKMICAEPKSGCRVESQVQDEAVCCPILVCDNLSNNDPKDSELLETDSSTSKLQSQAYVLDIENKSSDTISQHENSPIDMNINQNIPTLDRVLQLLLSNDESDLYSSSTTTKIGAQKDESKFNNNNGLGFLKLAGCNIYGRMYRVGRIISELSSSCLVCMCTEIGVQCKPLKC